MDTWKGLSLGLKVLSSGFFSHWGPERMLQTLETRLGGGSSKGVNEKLGLDENLRKWWEPN